jgi:hypothetical protein
VTTQELLDAALDREDKLIKALQNAPVSHVHHTGERCWIDMALTENMELKYKIVAEYLNE